MGKGLFLFCDAPQRSNDWVGAVLPFQHKSWLLRKDRKGTAEEINLMITKLPALPFWGVAASGMHCCSSAVPGASSNSGSAVPPFIPWTTSGVFCLLPQSFLFSCYSATEDCLEPSCKPSADSAFHHHLPHQDSDYHSPTVGDPVPPIMQLLSSKCWICRSSDVHTGCVSCGRALQSSAASAAFCSAALSHRAGYSIIPAFPLAQGVSMTSPPGFQQLSAPF